MKIIHKVQKYIEKTESYSIPRIIIEFAILDIILTLVLQITVFLFLSTFVILPMLILNPNADINHALAFLNFNQEIITEATSHTKMAPYAMFFAIIIAPLMETVIFQIFPIWIASFFTKKRYILVLTSAILFALAHVYPLLILYIFPGGVILAWTYVLLRKKVGGFKAYFLTAIIHALFNLINLIGALILGY